MARVKAFCVVNNNTLSTMPAGIQADHNGTLIGGYVWFGRVGVWNGLLITTTDTQLAAWNAATGNGGLVLVTMTGDERGELDIDIDNTTLTKLNTWLQARGFQTETKLSNRQIIRKLFRRLQNDFEFEQVEIN
jgi:hypothetical protein